MESRESDLPRISVASSIDEIRSLLANPNSGTYMVVVPTSFVTKVPDSFYSQLSDIIPVQFWADGPPDPHKIPQFRYAVLNR